MNEIAHARLASQRIAATPEDDPARTVAWMGAVQAQEYLAGLWAVGLRTAGAAEAAVERALRDGAIIRTWPMRGTLHFVAAADVRWMQALLTPRVIAGSAGRMRQLELGEDVVERARALFVGALAGGGQRTRPEMYALLEDAGIATANQRGYHLLWRTAQDGTLCEGARRGKQQTFALLDERVPAADPLPRDEALAELAARYFASHGPATVADLAWWSGLTVADVKRAIAGAGARLARASVDSVDHWRSPDTRPAERDASTAYLLPAFDEYLVGYRDRSAVLDPAHVKRINAGGGLLAPVMVIDGRVVGVWKRTQGKSSATIHATPFDPLGASTVRAFEDAAERYGRFLGMEAEMVIGG